VAEACHKLTKVNYLPYQGRVMVFVRFWVRRNTHLTSLLLCLVLCFLLVLLAPVFGDAPLISDPNSPQVGLVVASLKKDNTRWMRKLFPKWKIYRYVVDDASAEYTVPANKGREAMPYLTWVFQHLL
jgi:hypothetical protein